MITASENFISKVSQTSRRFTARLLCNGAEVTCDVKTVKIYKGACGDAFLPGSVYSSYIESVVDNLTVNIENKELELQIGLYLADGTVEYVPVGLYTVTKPKISAYQTTFTAVGRIASRLSVIFSPPSEKTIVKLMEAITAQTGVNITFKGITASGTIRQNLTGLTCRDVLEIIASVIGGFATEDNTGGIVISKFSADVTAEYTCERMLELPTFNEYDYSVSGIKVIVSDASEDEDGGEIEEVSFTSGDPKLVIKNSYMTAELFTAFTANLTGFTYRPGTVPLSLGDPRIEPWDCIRVIDVKGDSMIIPCMNIVHSFDGGLSTTIGAPGDSESGADASNKGPVTKAIERMAAELLTAEQAILKRLKADEAELTYAKITALDAESARIDNIAGDLSSYKEYVGEKFTGLEGEFQELDSVTLKTKDLSAEVAKLGYATIESLNVQTGRIDSLSGEYSEFKTTVTEQFSAVNAEIAETLKTKNLAAEVAKLGYVEADTLNVKIAELGYITADSADLKYVAIGEFNAVKGRVGTLEGSFSSFVSGEFGTLKSGVADIQTLIFGSATGNTITTEFANAVVAQIGTAQITSGMIKDLAFDKITGFDVNTTNVTVHSQDGKSQWKDNTIQISDANRVRVQIGKDASNDYNMYVWDASGNLMFDALGLTASGIQREIIRNDMVAADAAIDGSKLNIQSVVSAIDGSTYTLSSSHLIYDGKKLDLFLGDMSETATEHGNTLSSQGTQIVAIQGQIASKIWQDDIDTAASEMNAKYSNLEQNLNGFKTTVGETYSTKTEAEIIANAASTAQKAADTAQADVDSLETRVATAETNISQNTEQISLRATKTEVTTAKNEAINAAASDATAKANQAKSDAVSVAASDATAKANQVLAESKSYADAQIKISADNITSTVSSTYATKTENQTALSAAQAAQSNIDNLEIGGRNLIRNSKNLKSFINEAPSYISMTFTDTDVTVIGTKSVLGIYCDISVEGASDYTLSFNAADISGTCKYSVGGNDVSHWAGLSKYTSIEEGKTEVTFKTNAATTIARIYFSCHGGSDSFRLWDVKLEKGNKATDWTPAPEDVDAGISDAQSTADTAITNAATAQSTADTAKTNAATAQEKANAAAQAAANAQTSADNAQKAADKVKADLATTNANLSTVTSNLSKAQQDILTNAGLIDSQGNLIADNTALINSHEETISDHETRISQTETGISLKVSSSDFDSYKTTVTGDINAAKTDAIAAAATDATTKANQALANAKSYTIAEIKTVNESISTANTEISALKGRIALKVEQSDIDSAVSTVKTYADGKAADSLTEAKKYTDQRESAINLTLDGITSRVSGVESSQTTINGNVTDLQSRMSTAEEKITPAAIINTVSSTYATKAENQTATDAAEEARTIAEQTANKFTWIVKSGTSSSDFTLTDRVAQLTAANINLNGLVEFSGLDATTQSKVNSAVSDAASAVETASQAQSTASAAVTTANSASSTASAASTAASEAKSTANTASTNASNAVTTANAAKTIANTAKSTADTAAADASSALMAANSVDSVITAWCKDNDRTVIDGAKIYTGSITVDKLYVTDLKTIGATIGGFTIGDSAIYNGATSLAGADNSVYLGLDGISCGTKFKVDKKGVLSTADIKMEKTNTEDGITSTFGTYISSPETWTGSGLAVPEIKTRTATVSNGVTFSNELQMYPFKVSLSRYITDADNTWFRLEPTKLSMFSYISNNGFTCPELFIQPGGANGESSVTMGQKTHQIYSVEWTDDPYDYDDPLASCPHNMYPIKFNASTVTFNSAVAVKDQGLELYHATPYIDFHFGNSDADYTSRIIESASGTLNVQANLQVKGTAVSLSGHTHAILHNVTMDKDIRFVNDGDYCYFRPQNDGTSFAVLGSSTNKWYKTYTERLEVTTERIVCKPTVETTTTYAANVYVGTTGIFTKYKASTSSKYIKHDIKELQDETINAERLYDVDVVQFKYNEGELPNGDQRYLKDLPGFIIENMAEVYPIAVDKQTEESKGWSWNDHYIIPPMLKLIQNQHQVDILHEKRLNKTELRISALQNQLNEAMVTIAKQQKQIDLLMDS